MQKQPLSNEEVENLTTTVPTSNMTKAEADKTLVTGIAHKYEGAVKVCTTCTLLCSALSYLTSPDADTLVRIARHRRADS